MTPVIESQYPLSFHEADMKQLADHFSHHNSVNLIGMKRVGINNFLRFFLNHPEVAKTYFAKDSQYFFIHIDLNDLVEREIYPFWTLMMKRLLDAIEADGFTQEFIEKSKKLFIESIQLKDLLITVDGVRKIIAAMVSEGRYPIIIFNRFDRMKDAATPAFFENLQSLKDHANSQLSYLFTSYRPLWELNPEVFTKQALSVFCQEMYLKPANTEDASLILKTLEERYHLRLPESIRGEFLSVTGGHVQFMQLSMIKLRENTALPQTRLELIDVLLNNEEALLQSEEILESLTEKERSVLAELATEDKKETIVTEVPYLTQTGMVVMREEKPIVFSALLRQAIVRKATQKTGTGADFTKKENVLFNFLKSHEGELCEREAIVEAVWPDYYESGVSDWAVDRLIARVRNKLKLQKSPYEIVTVITRGYKLMKNE